MKKQIITILFLVHTIYAVACDCKRIDDLEKEQKLSFSSYGLIFIGKVVALNPDKSYRFEIIELLKGKVEEEIIHGKPMSFCSTIPYETGEIWLVYTDLHPEKFIDIPDCGLSRSFRFPYYYGSKYFPPPPPKDENPMVQLDHEMILLERRQHALTELRNEIEQLKKWN